MLFIFLAVTSDDSALTSKRSVQNKDKDEHSVETHEEVREEVGRRVRYKEDEVWK